MAVNLPNTPGRFIASTSSSIIRTVGGVGGVVIIFAQGRNFNDVLNRQKNPVIAGKVFLDRHRHGILPISLENSMKLSKLIGNEKGQRKVAKSFTSKYGRHVTHDIFVEHSLDVKCLPPVSSISLSLLNNVYFVYFVEKLAPISALLYEPISSSVHLLFKYYCSISPRTVTLILLTYTFVFFVLGYFEADEQYCFDYQQCFSKNVESKKNVILFTINFILYGQGFLPENRIKKTEENNLPKSCYMEKDFFLSLCFQDEIFTFTIE